MLLTRSVQHLDTLLPIRVPMDQPTVWLVGAVFDLRRSLTVRMPIGPTAVQLALDVFGRALLSVFTPKGPKPLSLAVAVSAFTTFLAGLIPGDPYPLPLALSIVAFFLLPPIRVPDGGAPMERTANKLRLALLVAILIPNALLVHTLTEGLRAIS